MIAPPHRGGDLRPAYVRGLGHGLHARAAEPAGPARAWTWASASASWIRWGRRSSSAASRCSRPARTRRCSPRIWPRCSSGSRGPSPASWRWICCACSGPRVAVDLSQPSPKGRRPAGRVPAGAAGAAADLPAGAHRRAGAAGCCPTGGAWRCRSWTWGGRSAGASPSSTWRPGAAWWRWAPAAASWLLGRLVLSGGLDVDEELLELNRAEVALDDATVSVSGRVETLCQPVLALDAQVFLPLRTLTQAGLLPRPASGHVWTRLTVNGRPAAPSVSVEVSASNLAYEQLLPDVAHRAAALRRASGCRVEKLSVPVGNGRVEVHGTVRLTPNLPWTLDVETDGRVLRPHPRAGGREGLLGGLPRHGERAPRRDDPAQAPALRRGGPAHAAASCWPRAPTTRRSRRGSRC